MSTETTELLNSLVRTRVLSEADARRLGDSSVAEIAAQLQSEGVVNPFQADRIAAHQRLFVGEYLLRGPIGQGGMGTVLEAWHPHLDRTVVLKSVAAHLPQQEELRRRFQRELQICGQLSHPNIVTVHDAVIQDGASWLVMEKLEGRDLGSVTMAQGPLSSQATVAIGIQAARGLQYAHGRGILHRDVKPSNLFLEEGSTVRVLDFGLALSRDAAAEDELVTSTGITLGTAAFMSPEQAIRSRDADARSDVYSLGCTLFYLLTGRTPYRGKTPIEQVLAHRDEDVPQLPNDVCGPAVRGVVRRMMAKDPGMRQQTMSEVIEDLACLIDGGESGLPIELASLSTLPPLPGGAHESSPDRRQGIPRHVRTTRIAVGAGVVVAGLLAAVWLPDWSRQQPIPPMSPPPESPPPQADLAGAQLESNWSTIASALQEANPGLKIPRSAYSVEDGSATIDLGGLSELRTLVPLGELPVDSLYVNGTAISDLSPLAGSRLISIDIGETRVSDLSPLSELSLQEFAAYTSRIRSLEPLRGMNPWRIDIHQTDVEDLSPLVGMDLEELDMHETKVTDLSPLAKIPLLWLDCGSAPVVSLEPVRSCPLQRLWCDSELLRGIDIQETWPTLERINDLAVEDWLAQRTDP